MKSTREMLDSQEFRTLVSRRWTVSVLLLAGLFILYYGYILLIAFDKPFLSQKIGEYTTLGIPLGVGVIVGSLGLTAIYAVGANAHDAEAPRLKDEVKK